MHYGMLERFFRDITRVPSQSGALVCCRPYKNKLNDDERAKAGNSQRVEAIALSA